MKQLTKTIQITNPDKIVFLKEKITKLDIINYYIEVADLMIPFVENRILSVIRCHDGIDGKCFFKKHPTNDKLVQVYNDNGQEYFYIKDKTELIYQVQLGTLEFHTWESSVEKINQPDIMVFDLDPDEKLSIYKLRDAVKKVKSVLDQLNLKSYLKTSGGKGYHIVVPFFKSKDWESFYEFSKQIAKLVESKWPNIFTTNIRKSERNGKIFIDFLRNNRGSTCIAPFSLRARDGATISFPIAWEKLDMIKPNEINLNNFKKYINKSWKDFFETQQTLN